MPQPTAVSQDTPMVEETPEAPASIIDLPTVPTVSSDSAAGLRSTGSQLSTYPTQRRRSESEPSAVSGGLSNGINNDSTAVPGIDTVRVLDGVELNSIDVDALFKM